MIIYNVTVQVNKDTVPEWVNWMQEQHIPELMQTGLFSGYRLCRLLEQDETEVVTFSAQYFCAQEEDYQTYIREYAPIMREKGLQRFGDRFIAFRTVMETVAEKA